MSEAAGSDPLNSPDALRSDMAAEGIEVLLAFHDGAHFIEGPSILPSIRFKLLVLQGLL
jgi:hypothetical protein